MASEFDNDKARRVMTRVRIPADKPPIGPPYTAWDIYSHDDRPMKFATVEEANAWCREKVGRFVVTMRVHEGFYG